MILHSWISPCRIWPTTFKLPALFLIDYPAHPRSAAWVHWAALHHSILGLKTNTPAWQTLQGVCISHHIQNEQWSLENITRRPSSRGRNSWLVTAERLLYSVNSLQLKSMIWKIQNFVFYSVSTERWMDGCDARRKSRFSREEDLRHRETPLCTVSTQICFSSGLGMSPGGCRSGKMEADGNIEWALVLNVKLNGNLTC